MLAHKKINNKKLVKNNSKKEVHKSSMGMMYILNSYYDDGDGRIAACQNKSILKSSIIPIDETQKMVYSFSI